MPVSSFMTAKNAERYSNQKPETAVYFAPTGASSVLPSNKDNLAADLDSSSESSQHSSQQNLSPFRSCSAVADDSHACVGG